MEDYEINTLSNGFIFYMISIEDKIQETETQLVKNNAGRSLRRDEITRNISINK